METASFNGLLRTILWIFAIYYIMKFLARLLLPVVVKKTFEKAEEHIRQQQEQYTQQNSTPKNTTEKPKEKKVVGEYIDYEEIE
ncbi:MAG TPA: DUF4834 domain-containing protein [Flavobacterium lutivivi]|nr:DUF4834 domain-containing protein [Flavobacterium lutivivi]